MHQKDTSLLFINPSLRPGAQTKLLPVGITSVMTLFHDRGHEFDLLDIDINDYDDHYVEEYLARRRYDVVLTGCIVTHYKWMKWLTHTIKKHHPGTKIVVGNSVAGSLPEVFLKNSAADVAVIGEGEYTALEVVEALAEGTSLEDVQGIAFVDRDGHIMHTPKRKACDIDELPMIDWDLLDAPQYFAKSDHSCAKGLVIGEEPPTVMPVVTARGCVFKCTFCHHVFRDDPYRHRSTEKILEEVKRNIDRYGATYISFWDDLSFASLKQTEQIAQKILESDMTFDWSATVRVDLFGNPRSSYEKRLAVAEKCKEAGCLSMGFSLESGNQAILDMMNKHVEVGYFSDHVELLKKVGISCGVSVVFGYPIETPQTIRETFDFCLRAGVYPSIGFLLPLPHTEMYDYAKSHGYITDDDAYLDAITERQDICLNMTKMPDTQIMDCIKEGAERLNRELELGLDSERLIRTGGYRNHEKKTAAKASDGQNYRLDPEHLKRNENDVSFNYSRTVFEHPTETHGDASAESH